MAVYNLIRLMQKGNEERAYKAGRISQKSIKNKLAKLNFKFEEKKKNVKKNTTK